MAICPKSTVKKKNDEGDHGGSPLQDFVGAGPRACPDTPGPIVKSFFTAEIAEIAEKRKMVPKPMAL
jgi:hypothetical protein